MADPDPIESELATVRDLDVDTIADAIQTIGFQCTHCGGCCTGNPTDPHTATVFPDEARDLIAATEGEWNEVVRPMPFGLDENGTGRTLEWALETDACGDCAFYDPDRPGEGGCTVYADRPLLCQTYPFRLAVEAGPTPLGDEVDRAGPVVAHECEGLGASIDREEALSLAETLKRRSIRELEEMRGVRSVADRVGPRRAPTEVIDSEGRKRPDGTAIEVGDPESDHRDV